VTASEVTGEKSYQDSITNQISFLKVWRLPSNRDSGKQNSNTFQQVSEGANKERSGTRVHAFTKMACNMHKVQLQTRNMRKHQKRGRKTSDRCPNGF